MRRLSTALAFGLAVAAGLPAARGAEAEKKPTPVPFYRKYLVPGDPLDERILEQERRVEAHPDDANLRNDFGNLLAERRFPAQAAEQYEIALKLDKQNFVSAYNLGLLRETEGKFGDAIAAYRRSIKRKPGFPQSRFRLGRLYEQSNQPESAVREYAAAMWIDPAIRDPKRNPLVVDCELVYLASLANYRRDVAVTAMTESKVYFDTERFRKLPTTRAIGSKEVESEPESESTAPRDVGAPAGPTGAGVAEPGHRGPATRPGAPPAAAAPPGAPPPGMLAPSERPQPGVRRPRPPVSPTPVPVAPPAAAPAEPVEPAPTPETPPAGPEVSPEIEPSRT
ncbi:MAG: tetratricopeptide repeat protein [Syntrophomonadaceae bacterium]